MEPTLQNGNALLLKKWGVPQKGDIVTAYIDELDYTVVKEYWQQRVILSTLMKAGYMSMGNGQQSLSRMGRII